MKVTFTYDRGKDVWCLLNKGKGGNHSDKVTEAYAKLVEAVGENPDKERTNAFLDTYLSEEKAQQYAEEYQASFDTISEEFQKRAERVFGVSLPKDVTAYLTVNQRCPYDITGSIFFVAVPKEGFVRIAMHELWHFYTWYAFEGEEDRLGMAKYFEVKESLTVLLNVVCGDLLPKGVKDWGYPQHQELREKVLTVWEEKQDIYFVWEQLTK